MIAVVIPTYNEGENLSKLIPHIFNILEGEGIACKLIIVDDNSTDNTIEVLQEFIERYPMEVILRESKQGIGSAYVVGFKNALKESPKLVFEMDADLSHDPDYIPDFLWKIEDGFDLVVGSRRIEGGGIKGWPLHRRIISWGGNMLGRLVSGVNVSDVTSGYRVYKGEVLESIELDEIRSDGYGFQLEILVRASKKGFRIGEIPIVFKKREHGRSKLSILEIPKFFILAIRIRLGLL